MVETILSVMTNFFRARIFGRAFTPPLLECRANVCDVCCNPRCRGDMPRTWKVRGEPATRIATVVVMVALSWFAAVKEQNRSRRADRWSYVIGLRTDLSCVPPADSAGILNILSRLDALSGRSRSCTGNRRWSDRRVMFATLDAGRVCIRSGDVLPDPDSCAAHEETAVEWMRETFAEAELQGSAAIMFIFLDGLSESHTEPWLSLREELARFRKPVVDIHRHSPPHRGDEPLQAARGGPFANLTRVVTGAGEVSGGENVQWMKINVDTRSEEVFSFAPR